MKQVQTKLLSEHYNLVVTWLSSSCGIAWAIFTWLCACCVL